MKKYMIGFLLGAILFSGIGAYAAIKFQANEIGYNNTTVDEALNDLYRAKAAGVEVAQLTTRGATYTMQHDGYITGTAESTNSGVALLWFNNEKQIYLTATASGQKNVSVYVPNGTTVSTRSDYGTYNLTVYEWK